MAKTQIKGLARVLPAGIRARLFLLITLVLLPQGLLLTWIYNDRYKMRRMEAMKTELEVAKGVAMAFSGYVEGVWRENHSIGESINMFSPPVLPKARRLLTTTASHHASVRNFNWVSPQGKILASSQPGMEGNDLSHLPCFAKVAAGAEWSICDLSRKGIKTVAPTFFIATACRVKGVLRGVIVATIEPERLGELTLTQQRLDKGAYAIFDSRGFVVYHSTYQTLRWNYRTEWMKEDPILQMAVKTKKPQVGIAVPVLRTGEWISARVPMQDIGWFVGAGTPVEVAFTPVRKALYREIGFSIPALALAFLLAYVVARTIALPLQRLEKATRGMGDSTAEAPDDPLAPLEVSRLRRVILEMAAHLRAEEKRFRLALENIPDMIVIFGQDLRIRYVNPAAVRAIGLSASRLIGQVDEEIWPEMYTRWRPILNKAQETASVQHLELEIPAGDGGNRYLHVTYVPLVEEDGRVKELMGIVHDYTVRKQAEDELKRTLEELLRSNRDLEQFAYVASHDLQEPLRMVASYVQLLDKRYRGQLDENADRYIDYAAEGAKRMQTLIEDLLSYGRINRGEKFEEVNLNTTVMAVTTALAATIGESGTTVEADDLPVVWGDRTQLFILFQNLIGNAIKYRRQDVKPLVRVSARHTAEAWVVSVRDNGIGIEDQYFDRIFQIFQRLHTRDEYSGTGIGLASCKRIVERHGGRIWVESAPGQGSTFSFTVPHLPEESRRQHGTAGE
ncbi:ATP-binding protein [Geotalea sp. SG265]|uniref:sensor histidine kinase n=1 Tax=Geotalea sp. SG265 TaxID=2922867 RepID=UPI001FAF94E5|nr:ATP-binding protein [Geotalea sp. SG265]